MKKITGNHSPIFPRKQFTDNKEIDFAENHGCRHSEATSYLNKMQRHVIKLYILLLIKAIVHIFT